MTAFDLLIRGAAGPGDVGVRDGVIAAVGPELEGAAREEVDARGLELLPGVVDAHVHLNEPGRADWEGFATGTAALAAGGATMAVDMPLNAHPPTVDGSAFDAKRDCGKRASRVDFALWGGLVPGNLEAMDELAARGVVGYKAFMADSGIADFAAADDLTLYEGMRRAAAHGLPVAVHAESRDITSGLHARAAAAGRTDMRDWLDSRPVVAETEAIARAIHLAEAAGCALHVVHVSTGRGVALVAEARARGADVSCETCPHYLLLTDEDAERLGAVAKCAPPLRPAAELEALWGALADGSLPMVASDHSPSPPAMKEGPVLDAWGGVAGAQTMLALVLGEGRLPRERVAEALAGFPARRLRLAGKGRIAPGADADLVLVDRAARDELRTDDLQQRHRVSPFVGRTLRARVVRTILRGRTVFSGGRLAGDPFGRLVTPA
ncbi:MAG TPA: allantoinase AllB [Solirubrobacteraceae bacterium]|nr:allantoinase AllB [Solirubrobacteraceae bacterium]